MLMKVRPITASWNILTHTGLLVLPGIERQSSVIPCLGFCSPGIATHILSALWFFLSWVWLNIDQVAQQGSIISDLGDTQKLTGHEPKQLALVGPALSRELEYMTSRSAFLFTVVNDSTISWLYGWGVEWSHQNNFCCAVSYQLKPDHRRSVTVPLFWIIKWRLPNAGYYSQYTQLSHLQLSYTCRYLLYFLIMQQKYHFTPLHPICVIRVELQHVLCENKMTYQKHIYFWIIGAMPADNDSCLHDFYSSSQVSHVRSLLLFLRH